MQQSPQPDYKKMYIMVNKKILTLPQCAVQSCHAVSEFMLNFGTNPNVTDWCQNHKTMVLLEAREYEIELKMEEFASKNKKFHAFYEPDLNNSLTAVAFEPVWNSEGQELFKKFNLI